MPIAASTRLLALLGDPVHHSLSPLFQNAAIRSAGLDAVYLALRCDRTALEPLLQAIARAGGGGNVTLPHKEAAGEVVEVRLPAVARTGVCNTFWLENGRIHGDNTDVQGFVAAARQLIGAPAGSRVLVLGAGGAARAAVAGLLDARVDAVHVANRSLDRATALAEALDPRGRRVTVVRDPAALDREGYDLAVNATSLGLRPEDPVPLDLDRPARLGAVLDLTYRPGTGDGGAIPTTAWVAAARAAGLPAADGREMLIQQGAASFRRWFGGEEPDVEAMRQALHGPGVGARASGE